MRVFVDTNVVISSILFPNGKTAAVFSHLLKNHTVVISSYTKDECIEVFQRKFPEKVQLIQKFFEGINYESFETPEITDTTLFPRIRDVKDLPVLASAILSDSDILLTGDKDFEDIKIEKPLIFTPSQYYNLIYRE